MRAAARRRKRRASIAGLGEDEAEGHEVKAQNFHDSDLERSWCSV